VANPKLQSQ